MTTPSHGQHPEASSPLHPAHRADDHLGQVHHGQEEVTGSVWWIAQRDAKTQRRGRYVPESVAHPAKMLPALARHAITHYTHPGDLVLDPMCGIGTTLVEAVHTGRHAIGIEYETRWARITAANLDLARRQGAPGHGLVITGDARHLNTLLDPALSRPAALILTSPPYGPHTHGQVTATGTRAVAKTDYRYAPTRRGSANLAHTTCEDLLAAFTDILTRAVTLLAPDGHVVITTRPFRRAGELIDLPAAVTDAARAAGLVPVERCVAPLAAHHDGHLVPRASFFQILAMRNARTAGVPQHVTVHEDVLTLTRGPVAESAVAGVRLAAAPLHRADPWACPGTAMGEEVEAA